MKPAVEVNLDLAREARERLRLQEVAVLRIVIDDVPDYGIVGGNPARLIRHRYDEQDVARLLALAWWHWPTDHITEHIRTIMSGSIDDLEAAAPRHR